MIRSTRIPRLDQQGLAHPKMKRVKVAKSRKATTPEAVLQAQAEMLLEYHCAYLHLPAEMFIAVQQSRVNDEVKISVMRKLKSFPDIMAFIPISDKYNLAWCPELKSDVGKLSGGQKTMGKEVAMPVIRDFDTFVEELKKFEGCAVDAKRFFGNLKTFDLLKPEVDHA